MKKRLAAVLLAVLLLAAALAGCSSGSEFASTYVQGVLDAIYLGQFNPEYTAVLDDYSEEGLRQSYLEGMAVEAEYFAAYFDVTVLTDETKAKLAEMYQEIYSHAKYEVKEAVKAEEGFFVEVVIYPIDIVQQVMEQDIEAYIDAFMVRYDAGEFAEMTDTEYEDEWAAGIIQLFYDRMDQLGYEEPQSLSVQVKLDESASDSKRNVYYISDTDMSTIDRYIIAY